MSLAEDGNENMLENNHPQGKWKFAQLSKAIYLFFESNKIIQFHSIESEAKKSPIKSFPFNQKRILRNDKNNNQSNEQITCLRNINKNIAILTEVEKVTERQNESLLHQRLVDSAKEETIKPTNRNKKGRNSDLNP